MATVNVSIGYNQNKDDTADNQRRIPSIACSDFVKRQTRSSRFSDYSGDWDELGQLAMSHWSGRHPGYRDGVVLIQVPSAGFRSPVVELTENDSIVTIMEARREGEAPAKVSVVKDRDKVPAKRVELVCYRADVLAEDDDRSTDAEWEIVSINASPDIRPIPMHPLTMARNERHLTGGTSGTYTKDEYIDAILFWSNHAMVAPRDVRTDQ